MGRNVIPETEPGTGNGEPSSLRVARSPFRLRNIVFWLHLVAGIVAGVIVFVMSVTGAFLVYERQIVAAGDSAFRVQLPSSGAARLEVEALLASVQEATKSTTNGVPVGLTLRADPTAPAAVSFGRNTTLFVDPYTGTVLGEATQSWRSFFRWATDWHRWLGREGEGRDVGKAITGACNLAFLFLVVSGLYLWFPRKWTKPAIEAVTVFNGRLSGKARDWNWHNVLGFWSALPLVFIVATGVVMSYPWANALLYKATGTEPPAQRGRPGEDRSETRSGNNERRTPDGEGHGGDRSARSAKPASAEAKSGDPDTKPAVERRGSGPRRGFVPPTEIRTAGLNAVWTAAEQKVAGWNYVSLRFPQKPGDPLTFLIDQGNGARPDLRATLTLDADSAKEVDWKPYPSMNAGQKARNWVRWIHTGEAGGWIGQIVGLLACLAAAVLVWTGFALTWRRFFGKKR
jgi:uncharacterized iron-regulated membrane protein